MRFFAPAGLRMTSLEGLMQIFLIIIHVSACLFLIATILLQAGRGGGMSDIAGGSQAQSILGTETNTFMKRMTEVFAVIFILTSLTLGIISTHRGKSLMEQKRRAQTFKKNVPLPAEVQKAIKEGAEASKTAAASSRVPVVASVNVPAAVKTSVPVATVVSVPVAIAPSAPVPAVSAQTPAEGNAK